MITIDILIALQSVSWMNGHATYSLYGDKNFVRQLLTSNGSFVFDIWFNDLDDIWK